MLVLSRRLNEKILFPGMSISVQVVAFKPGQVRLGIEAPPEVTVLREEVPDRVAELGAPASPLRGPATLLRLRKANQLLRNRLRAGGTQAPAELGRAEHELRLARVHALGEQGGASGAEQHAQRVFGHEFGEE